MNYDNWVLQIVAWTDDERLANLVGLQIEALAARLSARDAACGLTSDEPEMTIDEKIWADHVYKMRVGSAKPE